MSTKSWKKTKSRGKSKERRIKVHDIDLMSRKDLVYYVTKNLIKTSNNLLKNEKPKDYQDNERAVAIERLLSDIATMDVVACDLFGNFRNWSGDVSFELVLKCRDAMQSFNIIKQRILNSIWSFDVSDKESISDEIEKLQYYFNELHSDNVKSIQNWREKLMSLQDRLEKVQSDLNKALHLNSKLSKQFVSPDHEQIETADTELPVEKIGNHEFDKIAFLNIELKEKLKKAEIENKDIKNKLISNVREIYQIAEFKAFVAEDILRLGLAINETKSFAQGKHSPPETKHSEIKQKNVS
ncbi:uncharacterized protein CDAR_365691 [Caerostris darwini]|uniref:Uncharacterized protein n=1 Tax=Caerostris darwini TaxID=1538125 RepID=A0AAV4RD44_9ARAC|nr:uncharacterized protein CDAR_365691 [Caerostris darwini]